MRSCCRASGGSSEAQFRRTHQHTLSPAAGWPCCAPVHPPHSTITGGWLHAAVCHMPLPLSGQHPSRDHAHAALPQHAVPGIRVFVVISCGQREPGRWAHRCAARLQWAGTVACMKCTGQVLWLRSQPQASEQRPTRQTGLGKLPAPSTRAGRAAALARHQQLPPALPPTPLAVTARCAGGRALHPTTRVSVRKYSAYAQREQAMHPPLVELPKCIKLQPHASGTSCTNKSNAATCGSR